MTLDQNSSLTSSPSPVSHPSVRLSNNLTALIRTMLQEQGGRPVSELTVPESPSSEVIYVVVVIVFYAAALMMLIGSQMRQSKRQTYADENYYEEYLKRKKSEEKKKQKQNVMRMTGMKDPHLLEFIPEHEV